MNDNRDFSEAKNAPVTEKMNKHLMRFFVTVSLCLMLIPAVSHLFPAEKWQDPSQASKLTTPSLTTSSGELNLNYLRDGGTYLEKTFPFRGKLIGTAAALKRGVFSSSITNQVVTGKDGYLFYGDTLDDYLGFNRLSSRGIDNAATNLKILSEQAEERGIQFTVALAPNKNTLYGNYMPNRYLAADFEDSNLNRLQNRLGALGVPYVDFTRKLKSSKEVLYQKADTHWNFKGAYAAADYLLEHLQVDNLAKNPKWKLGTGFVGDIEKMQNPTSTLTEPNWRAEGINDLDYFQGNLWEYADDNPDATADLVQTTGQGEKNLFMFRDSFGNSLVPVLSPSFATAQYSKLIPYDITYAFSQEPEVLVVERAERLIPFFATEPPALASPSTNLNAYELVDSTNKGKVKLEKNGIFKVINGTIPAAHRQGDVEVFARITTAKNETQDTQIRDYQGYRKSITDSNHQIVNDYGYRFYIPQADITANTRIEIYAASKAFGLQARKIGEIQENGN